MSGPIERRHLVLIGMMGSGKTTTGRAIAGRLAWPLWDCDAVLEARVGSSGAQIAARQGVDELHRLEEEVLLDALAEGSPTVITAAGWVVESERCRDAMAERAFVVWLDVPIDELLTRMTASDHRRPIAREAAEALLERRRLLYTELADLHLDAREPTDDLVAAVLTAVAAEAERWT